MKQRLVGALVLGCLALIFIPLLLDGDGLSPPEISTRIPAQPDIDISRPAEPQRPLLDAASQKPAPDTTATEIPVPEELASADVTGADTQPEMNAQGLPQAWSVRLGIFGDRKNAESLLNSLLQKGYKAYSRPQGNAQRELTGVFVGPLLSKAEAEEMKAALNQEFELNGLVVRFAVDSEP